MTHVLREVTHPGGSAPEEPISERYSPDELWRKVGEALGKQGASRHQHLHVIGHDGFARSDDTLERLAKRIGPEALLSEQYSVEELRHTVRLELARAGASERQITHVLDWSTETGGPALPEGRHDA